MTGSQGRTPLSCPRCGAAVGGGRVLFQHLRGVHGLTPDEAVALIPEMTWRCAFCGRELPDQDELAAHVRADHGVAPISLGP